MRRLREVVLLSVTQEVASSSLVGPAIFLGKRWNSTELKATNSFSFPEFYPSAPQRVFFRWNSRHLFGECVPQAQVRHTGVQIERHRIEFPLPKQIEVPSGNRFIFYRGAILKGK